MSKKNKDNDIIVSLIGGQSEDVTGSATLISYVNEYNERRCILCELGLIQGNNSILAEYRENKKMLESIPYENIDYVFTIHNHIDHTGSLPSLIANNYRGRIITTYENKEIMKKLLVDASYINQKNIQYLKSKGHKVTPSYTDQDTYELFNYMDVYGVGEMYKLDNIVSFRYSRNSHVVGATQLELWIKKKSGQIKKILITSDLGSKVNKEFQNFLYDTEIINKANLVLMESTYGGKPSFTKQDCINERTQIKKLINEYVLENKNRCFIPCFSYGRLQNQMCMIYEMFKDNWDMDIPIVIDTKLGNAINDTYDKILEGKDLEYWQEVKNWKAFKYIRDYKGTMAFLTKRQSSLILSSSGMISAGHSVLYAKQILSCSKDIILFCGYCSPNTIGGKILNEEQRTVAIEGEVILKRCRIERFNTFSSHAQEDDLIDYIKAINCDKIVLHHGSKQCKEDLKNRAIEELRKINKTTPIVCSVKDMQLKL